ncbi:DUF1492 domain-containing protein [Tetragenococcus halophilus]|uniref:DUF1492 domain-containing protein n=1 Tax=Tetragenococcus halophilus TaxID=51669 RepID=A0AB35HR70_TETHA|nr:DUF1492 domain-containing protein [Tetragenococcus halophilus]MCO8298657.1 DUF1492 domain-containing protein [Tetragenococcus halophilus]
MDAKKYLEDVKFIDYEIDSLEKEKERLLQSLESSPDISEEKVTSSPAGSYDDKVIKVVEKRSKLEDKINSKVDELVDLKEEAIDMIDQLDNRWHRIILRRRYIDGDSLVDITNDLPYVYKSVNRLHDEAMENFRKIYNMS